MGRRGGGLSDGVESTGDPRWAGELGLLELSLRRYRDAAEHLRRALEGGDALASGARARLRGALQQAAQEVVEVAIVAGKPEAELFMDGRRVGQGFVTYVVYVEPGSHEARATLQGHEDGVGRFEAQRGDKLPLGLALKEKPPAPRPAQPGVAPCAAAAGRSRRRSGRAGRRSGRRSGSARARVGGRPGRRGVRDRVDGQGWRGRVAARGACSPRAGSRACHSWPRGINADARCPQLEDAIRSRDALGLVALVSVVASGVVGAAALSSSAGRPRRSAAASGVVPQATARGGGVRIEGAW